MNFTPRNEEGDSLLPEFANHVNFQCGHLLAQKHDFEPKDFLAKRVRQTIIRRWRLMCYQMHHADLIASTQDRDSQAPMPIPEDSGLQMARPVADACQAVKGANESATAVMTVARTEQSIATTEQTTATTLPPDHEPWISKPSVSSSIASSRTQFSHGTLAFPRPPKPSTDEWEFICPYCCLPQPARNLARSKWE